MSLRFPRHGAGRRQPAPVPGSPPSPGEAAERRDAADATPDRACCCPARPAVKVVLPPGAGRAAPVDLWLCGHHWRRSREALASAGADVADVSAAFAERDDGRQGVGV